MKSKYMYNMETREKNQIYGNKIVGNNLPELYFSVH